jgi:hypothetical protein
MVLLHTTAQLLATEFKLRLTPVTADKGGGSASS